MQSGLQTLGMMLLAASASVSCAAKAPSEPEVRASATEVEARASVRVVTAEEATRTCGASKSPMFEREELLNLRIEADFTRVNTAPREADTLTHAVVTFPDGEAAPVTPDIVARGNLRFRDCASRPFSLKFSEGQSDGTPFDKLGKTVKFATHCGDKEGMAPDLKAPTPEEYEQRVIMEHSVYQVLDQLGVTSLKTRLARVTYHDTQTHSEETHFAIVIEPRDKMAKRCGLVDLEDAESVPPSSSRDEASVLLTHLLNGFVIQSDWALEGRNTMTLVDPKRHRLVYAPYDFDMAGINRPDYLGNRGRSLAENGALFSEFLRHNQSATLFRQLDVINNAASAIQASIQRALMDEPHRQLFQSWFNHYLPLVNSFRSCEGQVENPERPECYVEDDYGDQIETATPLPLGESTVQVMPPGDVDVFAVELNQSTLYTLEGRVDLELVDGNGNLLAKSTPAAPVSFRVPAADTAYLKASLGEELVAVPLKFDNTVLNSAIALYPDDHGASLETATAIRVGQSQSGRWETRLASLDHDWFSLESTSVAPQLLVNVDSLNYSEIWAGCIEAPEQVTVATLDSGANDLSYFFEDLACPSSAGSSKYWLELTGKDGAYALLVQDSSVQDSSVQDSSVQD